MGRFKVDKSAGDLFVRGDLEELLPDSSVARTVWMALGKLNFSVFDEIYRNDVKGAAALDPRRLAAVWIVALTRNIDSSVQLAQQCVRDVELRWLLGDNPVQKSTLCAFRRDHVERLAKVSTQVLAAMAMANLLPAAQVAVDGTVVRAAASCRSNRKRKRLKKAVRELKEVIERKLAEPEQDQAGVSCLEGKKKRLDKALATMDEMGLVKEEDSLTLTEPAASKKKLKDGSFAPAHNVQVVTDLQSGAIIHAEIIEQGNDSGQLAPQIEKAVEVLSAVDALLDTPGARNITAVAADSAYHKSEDMVALEVAGITTFVPNDGNDNRTPPGVAPGFTAAAFTFDATTNTLRCPAGQSLRHRKNTDVSAVYQGSAKMCDACPFKNQCCPNTKHGRNVNRPLPAVEPTLSALAKRVASPEGKTMAAKRRTTAEGAFARLKERLHWRRCRMWGRAGAAAELLWRQLAHNLFILSGFWKPLIHDENHATA